MHETDYDIYQTAIALTQGDPVTAGYRLKVADALLAERNANRSEIAAWRDRWRVASFSLDASAAVADDCRRYAKQILNTNSTFVDDDLRLLAHLADQAVAAGLTGGLPVSVVAAIEEKRLADRQRPLDE